jgi:hypothetical protein
MSEQFDETIVPCPECGFENTADFLECVSCGAMLKSAAVSGAAEGGFVEVASTRDPKTALQVTERLKAAGVEYEVLDLGGAKPDDLSELLYSGQRMVPLMVLVPAEDEERAEAALAGLRTGPSPPDAEEAETLCCPECNEPYRLEDYDPMASRIFCSTCRTELPRHGPSRFRGLE